jgi:hypothetical protein
VRAVLEELDEDVRASVVDALIARATKATSGWRPTRPSQRIAEEAKSFAEAARHIGHAWRVAPSLTRLLRWLAVDGHEQEPLRTKATRAVARCPKTAVRQIGLLRVILGDVTRAAALLSKSPGLG